MSGSDASPPRHPGFSSTRLLILLGPFIAAGALLGGIAVVAAFLDWHRDEMLLVAAAIGGVVIIPSIYVIYRQGLERQATQALLQSAEARVGGIVESAMDAVISVDEKLRIVLFNAAAERAFRWPRAAVMGQPLDILLPERYRAAHRAHIERFGRTTVTSRGMAAQTVLHGLRADGEEFPIEASISQHVEGGRKFYTVILRDVTERVRAERLVARSEARLRGILESAMDAIITVDERQHIVLFNRAAEEVFGCPRDQAIGAPLAWFIPQRFRQAHAGMIKNFSDTGTSSRRMGAQRIVMGLRRNGEEFPIDASISQIEEEGQKFYTVILRDVTERTHAEEQLKRSREEIRELSLAATNARERERSRIARELHDELGQALTALKIDVGWLRENLGNTAPDPVARKLTSMHVLLDGTVAAARRISSDLRPLMLDDLGLTAACDWLVQNFRNRTGIACELVLGRGDLDLPDPYASALFRVLQESLTNIAKHADATQVEVALDRADGEVHLHVRDNGRGFATDAPRKEGSFGLMGLRERAYLLGGDVRVQSEPGQGTTVDMHVPIAEKKMEQHT